jgi:hypothetical protein
VGAVVGYLLGAKLPNTQAWRVFPMEGPIETGIGVEHGLTAAWLKDRLWEQRGFCRAVSPTGAMYVQGAAELVHMRDRDDHLGYRFVTINQFSTVFDLPSWDCHADGGSLRTDLNDIRNIVAPQFDTAFAALLTDLDERGLLDSTLVVATGEFGRTPKLNSNGGRDHWANAWTAIVAGGGTQGGRVIGRTDSQGTEPTDRPVTPQELVASIFHAMSVSADATIPGPDGKPVAVYPGQPVSELF